MVQLHPAVVHFPVALLSIAALFALISLFTKKEFFKEAAFWNLLLGVVGAIAAVLTGLIEEQTLVHNDEIHRVLVKHKFIGFGILVFSFSLLTWIWVRKGKAGKNEYILWTIFLVLATAIIFYQGYLGGKMVFEQGAGVKSLELQMEQEGDSEKTHSHSGTGHGHGSSKSASPPKKPASGTGGHVHPESGENKGSQDTTKIPENTVNKEKKKQLKDMKY